MQRTGTIIHAVILLALIYLWQSCDNEVTPETALQHYLNRNDGTFAWGIKERFNIEEVDAYNLLLTSQQWRGYRWQHQLTVLVPEKVDYDGAMLFITGGSLADGEPKWKSHSHELIETMAGVAGANRAVVAIIWQVPNQPLFEGDLTEDELISYTLHHYRQDKDFSWPLLFPMVKSAMAAMQAVQEFSEEQLGHRVKQFMVSGASKRGWTTWLTGAHDRRVAAIAPMVIDVLNMPVNLDYQVAVWGDYSPQIEDYVKLGIPQDVHTEDGEEITAMVDPYSYRNELTMPKMLIIGTNDEYWPVDAVKHYIDDIPGDNSIHYVPNAGHDLDGGEGAIQALSAFFAEMLQNKSHPKCAAAITGENGRIHLRVDVDKERLEKAHLWVATAKTRDFRTADWTATELPALAGNSVETTIGYPESGYQAFYMDLVYDGPDGDKYSKSTRIYVCSSDKLFLQD
jgi:PhoPQ-activated pathogenicity-related protein